MRFNIAVTCKIITAPLNYVVTPVILTGCLLEGNKPRDFKKSDFRTVPHSLTAAVVLKKTDVEMSTAS